jgi:lysophospholipase L1-like esterase
MQHPDDSRLNRFDDPSVRHFRARDSVLAVLIGTVILIILAGGAVEQAAKALTPGIGRDLIEVAGEPTGWVARKVGIADERAELTSGLSPDAELVGEGFDSAATTGGNGAGRAIPPVTSDYFDPTELGQAAEPELELGKVLVTGDSMSQPLDAELGRRLIPDGIETIRDPHLGTGISRTDLVDWSKLSATQAQEEADAVVLFLGAGDGYPMPGPDGREVECCGPEWAAIYANRARQVIGNYLRGGTDRIYWLTVPTPRDDARARITRVVNAALIVASQPFRSQVRIIDTVPVFTPGGSYRDSFEIDGRDQVVRESDGLHLTPAGAGVAADLVEERLAADFVR